MGVLLQRQALGLLWGQFGVILQCTRPSVSLHRWAGEFTFPSLRFRLVSFEAGSPGAQFDLNQTQLKMVLKGCPCLSLLSAAMPSFMWSCVRGLAYVVLCMWSCVRGALCTTARALPAASLARDLSFLLEKWTFFFKEKNLKYSAHNER